MLIIRDAQLDSLRLALLGSVRERLLEHLRSPAAALPLSGVQLETLIARGLKEAPRFRIAREADLLRFITILNTFCGGDNARALPVPALQILLGYGVETGLKLDRFACWVGVSMAEAAQAECP